MSADTPLAKAPSKVCIGCNKNFKPNSSTHIYCGSRKLKYGCAYEHYRDWSREMYANFTPEQKLKLAYNKASKRILKKYGISSDEYEQLLIKQDFKCAICGEEKNNVKSVRLYIDHNHDTGKVRALLCHWCNAGIGMFFESTEKLEKAIEYIKKHES